MEFHSVVQCLKTSIRARMELGEGNGKIIFLKKFEQMATQFSPKVLLNLKIEFAILLL